MRASGVILAPNGQLASLALPGAGPVGAERVKTEKQSRFNPLRNWTPDVLQRQLEAYAQGYLAPLAWIMEWLEKHDETISTAASKAKAAVSRYGYDVMLRDEITDNQKQMAEDQRGVLQAFYESVEVGHGVELEEKGGFRLLVQQIMDAYGKGYAAHHIQWQPSAAGLGAKLTQIPGWFWEATTGRLRFLPSTYSTFGVERETMGGASAWMISKGRGVMLAGVIARMFKQIPLQDWLTYCDRHGMPAFLGKTSAAKGTAGWLDMMEAVSCMGSEFSGVINTGDVIDVLDLTSKGELPYEKMVDRMDRAQVMLWRGGDLSTMSRTDGVGASTQTEETDELDGDNAEWVGETLDRTLAKQVIAYYFGPSAPMLVKTKLRTKTRQNVTQDLATVKAAKEMGVRISKPWFIGKFGIVEADANEAALGETEAPAPVVDPIPPGTLPAVINSADAEALLTNSLGKALGVRPGILSPIKPLISHLESTMKDGGTTDAAWLQFVEDAALSLPELFDPAAADQLASDLEAAMGTAVVQGTRDALREQSAKPTSDK